MLQRSAIERALVVTAHPDDVDFGAAGTIAALTSAGVNVTYCLVTDGDAGGDDRTVTRAEVAALRRKEQIAAAHVVGVDDLVFLGHGDGRLQATLELRRDISRVIRQVRPRLVISQSPERNLDRIFASHPDHLAAGEAALAAVYPDSRNPFAFPELLEAGLEPWTVEEVWLLGHHTPTDPFDITDHVEAKISALMCHASQLPDPAGAEERVRGWVRHTAAAFGLPVGACAEAFRVVRAV
ncbi:MAG: PIG-L deacetylase family protein [Actinomycetota bacterium]